MFDSRTARLFALVSPVLWLATVGCEAQQRDSAEVEPAPAAVPTRPPSDSLHPPAPRTQPVKPDLTRMTYDPANRTLTLYELPDRSAKWVVSLPMERKEVPVDAQYQFPPGVDFDPDQVTVFFTVPNRLPSPAVTLREIQDAGATRAQR